MNLDKLFVNKRYTNGISNKFPMYVINNGNIKRYVPNKFSKNYITDSDIWYKLEDLPKSLQEKLADVSITGNELRTIKQRDFVYSKGNRKNISDKTLIMPVVGKLLPQDGVQAYTAILTPSGYTLKEIIVCWPYHWSDLFTGNTKYGNNVFCLASELSDEQIEEFAEDIIPLENVGTILTFKNSKSNTLS